MKVSIQSYTQEMIPSVVEFEGELRNQETVWGWSIDADYIAAVTQSFERAEFDSALSFLALEGGKVVGRIDASLISSHFDGSVKAYLDWICVLKDRRHCGIAQALMVELRRELKQRGVTTLIGLIASNRDAQSFYRSLDNALIRDEGIRIDIM